MMEILTVEHYYEHTLQGDVSPSDGMNIEFLRTASFENWPSDAGARPIPLAAAGFYRSGEANGDETTCFSCGLIVSRWESQQDPLSVHRQLAPHCRFLQGNSEAARPALPDNAPVQEFNAALSLKDCPELLESLGSGGNPSIKEGARRSSGVFHSEGLQDVPPPVSSPMDGTGDPRSNTSFSFLDRMRCEDERLKTFRDWKYTQCQSPATLAAAGFFYTGVLDRVQCPFCRGVLRSWDSEDSPRDEHLKHFPVCPFILGRDVNNVASTANKGTEDTVSPPPTEATNNLGILSGQAKHPTYAVLATREESFRHPSWKATTRQTPQELSAAGFFYTGHADNVKCFSCDGGLRNWEPQDEPWTEHAKWFPRCQFVRLTKGETFIQKVHGGHSVPGSNESPISAAANAASSAATDDMRRAIRARMDTETVKSVIGMGYSKDTVHSVIEKRLLTTGDDFPNAMVLLEAIFDLEEKMKTERLEMGKVVRSQDLPTTSSGAATRDSVKVEALDDELGSPSFIAEAKKSGKRRKRKKKNASIEIEQPKSQENSGEDMQSLMIENEEMKEQKICKVCMDNDCNVVFLPCGHLVCCTNCAPALRFCPICRTLIKGTVRVYLS